MKIGLPSGVLRPPVAGLMLILAALALAWKPATAAGDLENKAQIVAEAWLEMMDAGRYGEGWDQAAPIIKSSVNRHDFVKALEGVRTPLGPLISRRFVAKSYDQPARCAGRRLRRHSV